MQIADRYASAIASANLRVQADVRGDADVIVASAWAGSGGSLASLIHRARVEHDRHPQSTAASTLAPLVAALRSFIDQRAAVLDVDLSGQAQQRLALAVADVLLRPTCRSCGGRGFGVIAGTARLSDSACEHCAGSGRRQVYTETPDEATLVRDVQARLEDKMGAHARRMGRYLRR